MLLNLGAYLAFGKDTLVFRSMVYAGPMAQPVHEPDYDPAAFEAVAAVGRALRQAQEGNVISLHGRHHDVTLMPTALAEAALEALEDAEDLADIATGRGTYTPDDPGVPLAELQAEVAAKLAERG